MASFAPVCPIHILESLIDIDQAGNYHLPLAHDVIHNEIRYERAFKVIREQYGHYLSTVILDNSVIELGSAVNIEVIAAAAKTVKANVIVLPDVLLDASATITQCRKALDPWSKKLDHELGEGNYTFMYVPQGTTPNEFAACAEALAEDERIGWWGIPRNYNIKGLGSRRDAVDIVHMLNPKRNIHLLGFSDNILDDILSARHPAVTGMDSAVPLRAASHGVSMSFDMDKELPPRGDWWEDPKTVFDVEMVKNLKWIRRHIGDHQRKIERQYIGGSVDNGVLYFKPNQV